MRFTVKAKLASAFGVVILLSMVAGGMAYMKLTDMIATAESLVSRAGRMEKAAELEKSVLLQVRAEKNVLISSSDAETERFVAEIGNVRNTAARTKDEIYPIVDLRTKLNLPPAKATEATRIIILDVPVNGSLAGVGFVADCVFEVTDIDESEIKPPPSVGGRWQSDYLAGVGRKGDKFVIIFDLARLMASTGMPVPSEAELDTSVAV